MKKFLVIVMLAAGLGANAQQAAIPTVKQGSTLNYIVYANGQEVPLTVTVDSMATDYVKLGWNISGYGTGGWIMKKPSLDKGNRNAWEQPGLGMDTELPDDQVVLTLSRATWAALNGEKKAEIDQQVFNTAQQEPGKEFQMDGKPVDALFIQTANGSSKMWYLNQPTFPVLLKIQGNPAGYDLELRSIE